MVEEDTLAVPYRSRVLEKAHQVVWAKQWLLTLGLNIPHLLVLSGERRDHRGYVARVQPDVILGLLEEGIIPCFNDSDDGERKLS